MTYKETGKKMKLSVGSVHSLIKGEGIVQEPEETPTFVATQAQS